MDFIFFVVAGVKKLKKPQKTWISFFASLKEEVFFPAGLRFCVPKCTDESRSKIVDFYAMKTSKVCRK